MLQRIATTSISSISRYNLRKAGVRRLWGGVLIVKVWGSYRRKFRESILNNSISQPRVRFCKSRVFKNGLTVPILSSYSVIIIILEQ